MFDKIKNGDKRAEVVAEYTRIVNEYKQTEIFPKTNIPTDFLATVRKVLCFANPDTLQMTTAPYKGLKRNYDLLYTFLDMGTIIFAMQKRTQSELAMSDNEYDDYLDLLDVLTEDWKTIQEKAFTELAESMEANALVELGPENEKILAFEAELERHREELAASNNIPLGVTAQN